MPDSHSLADSAVIDRAAIVGQVRGTGPMLLLGMLLTVAALMVPRVHMPMSVPVMKTSHPAAQAPVVVQAPARPLARPSVYTREAAMSPVQLMQRWDGLIKDAAHKFHVPEAWIRAVMRRESGGRTMMAEGQPIVSSTGAMGLMQIDPKTYDEMRRQYGLGRDPFDAQDNIFAGAAYLGRLHRKYGYPAMFAAYNAGPGRLEDHLHRGGALPAQTRAYVGGITRMLGAPVIGQPVLVRFTRPDGRVVRIDAAKVTAVRPALPGEYGGPVQTVIRMGTHKQAIRENLEIARSAIRAVGGLTGQG